MITSISLLLAAGLLAPLVLRSFEFDQPGASRPRRSPLLYAAAAFAVLGIGLLLARSAGLLGGKDNLPVLSTPDQMQQALAGEGLVVLDFYSPSCGPCRQLAPIVRDLSKAWVGQATFYKINVDATPDLTAGYDVTGVPLLVFFRDGRMIDRMTGLQDRQAYDRALSRLTGVPVPVQPDPPSS